MPIATGFRRKRWSMGLSCGHSRIIATQADRHGRQHQLQQRDEVAVERAVAARHRALEEGIEQARLAPRARPRRAPAGAGCAGCCRHGIRRRRRAACRGCCTMPIGRPSATTNRRGDLAGASCSPSASAASACGPDRLGRPRHDVVDAVREQVGVHVAAQIAVGDDADQLAVVVDDADAAEASWRSWSAPPRACWCRAAPAASRRRHA